MFILCCHPNAKLWEDRRNCDAFNDFAGLRSEAARGALRGFVEPRPAEKGFMGMEWSAGGKPAMTQWLSRDVSADDRARLRALGNCVVPAQARLGFECLLRIHRQAASLPL